MSTDHTRAVVTERQHKAAYLLLDGWSAYRALIKAGYSHWTSRNFGLMYRHSWGLRRAIELETERRQHSWNPAPAKRKRYDRRAVANAILEVKPRPAESTPKFRDTSTNCPICRKLVRKTKLLMDPSGRYLICETCAITRFS